MLLQLFCRLRIADHGNLTDDANPDIVIATRFPCIGTRQFGSFVASEYQLQSCNVFVVDGEHLEDHSRRGGRSAIYSNRNPLVLHCRELDAGFAFIPPVLSERQLTPQGNIWGHREIFGAIQ